ncbi:NUDIX domain-containing protein [Paractinoplanes hotanensis]|uniref:NUDIX hydrolase n=1 Tax=Paractinoplanes hotanensis TaxID=2906497 RepID=A0ABT0Y9U4_9ACTN|nr:NUDIX hydrolase [Actinoplanes hotanensis]MCM4082247.1 NUDIX hydrolase [Actinoplanes hotanensis]
MTDYTATPLPRKRMGTGVMFTNQDGHVLLVEPTYKDYWEIPGGAVEADESPRATTIREIVRNSGWPSRPGGC